MADPIPKIIRACSLSRHYGELNIQYIGTADELVAAGAITEKLLEPVGRGKSRFDLDGERCRVFRLPNGQQRIERCKRDHRAVKLPGVAEWLAEEAGVPLIVCLEVTAMLERIRIREGAGQSGVGT